MMMMMMMMRRTTAEHQQTAQNDLSSGVGDDIKTTAGLIGCTMKSSAADL